MVERRARGHGQQDAAAQGQVCGGGGGGARGGGDAAAGALQALHEVRADVVGEDAPLQDGVEGAQADEDGGAAGAGGAWEVGGARRWHGGGGWRVFLVCFEGGGKRLVREGGRRSFG